MNTFAAGGPFMTPITIIGLIMLALGGYVIARSFADQLPAKVQTLKSLVLQLGVFAFFLGLLSQAMGLMQAFQAIQQIGDVSPAIVAGGLYVSLIAPAWGLIVLLVGLVLNMAATYRIGR